MEQINGGSADLIPSPIQVRNLWMQVFLMIITFGMYSAYWYYVVTMEMCATLKQKHNVFLWTLFLGIPPFLLYSYYKQGEVFEEFTKGIMNRWITFILWMVFPPAVWFMIQTRLNELGRNQIPVI